MKNEILIWLGIGVLTIGAVIFVRIYVIADTKYLGAAQENAETQVVEQSKTYRDGVRRDMDELLLSYKTAKSPDEKATVLSVMRHRAEGVPSDLVPIEVKQLLGM